MFFEKVPGGIVPQLALRPLRLLYRDDVEHQIIRFADGVALLPGKLKICEYSPWSC